MKFRNKKILPACAAFLLVCTVMTQKSSGALVFRTAPGVVEIDTIIDTTLVNLQVTVQSSKKGVLGNLTAENFEVYDSGKLQKVEFCTFDQSTNKYSIAFAPEKTERDKKRYRVKLKIKLSAEEKKEYGKITVDRRKWIFSKPEQK